MNPLTLTRIALLASGFAIAAALQDEHAHGADLVVAANFKAKEGTPDAEAKKVIEGIYDSSVDNLKKQLGG